VVPGDESVVDLASSDWLMLWSSGCASSSSSFCMLTGKKDVDLYLIVVAPLWQRAILLYLSVES